VGGGGGLWKAPKKYVPKFEPGTFQMRTRNDTFNQNIRYYTYSILKINFYYREGKFTKVYGLTKGYFNDEERDHNRLTSGGYGDL
jgi:hypothetical protein